MGGQHEFTLLFTPHGNENTKIQNSTIGCIMPLQPWYAKFWRFQLFWKFPKITFTSIERNFAKYISKHNCLLVAPSLYRILFAIRPLRCFRKQFLVLLQAC